MIDSTNESDVSFCTLCFINLYITSNSYASFYHLCAKVELPKFEVFAISLSEINVFEHQVPRGSTSIRATRRERRDLYINFTYSPC